jgi:hypothetical protein
MFGVGVAERYVEMRNGDTLTAAEVIALECSAADIKPSRADVIVGQHQSDTV